MIASSPLMDLSGLVSVFVDGHDAAEELLRYIGKANTTPQSFLHRPFIAGMRSTIQHDCIVSCNVARSRMPAYQRMGEHYIKEEGGYVQHPMILLACRSRATGLHLHLTFT